MRSRPSAEKTNLALRLSVVRSGPDSIRTGGGTPPISQLHSAGVGSMLPAASTARTRNSCSPNARSVYVTGDGHGWKKPVSAASSSAHWNVTFCALDVKASVAVVLSVTSSGPERIAVSGMIPIVQR
jgi:hypothetical protein